MFDQDCAWDWNITANERHDDTVSSLLALNGGGRFLSPSSPLSSLLCSLVSWETLSALLSKLKYYGLTGLLMQLTLWKLGFWGTWLPWRNVRSRLYDGAWERWRTVCLAALSVEDIEDIYLFGTMITGILLIGLGFSLGYRRIQKTGTAVQSPTRLPVWLKLWEERSAVCSLRSAGLVKRVWPAPDQWLRDQMAACWAGFTSPVAMSCMCFCVAEVFFLFSHCTPQGA